MRRRKRLDDATLAAVMAEHQACLETLDEIGKKYGITGAYICKLAKVGGWPPRRAIRAAREAGAPIPARSEGVTGGDVVPAVEPPARPKKKRPKPDVRTMIKRRMCKVINRKLREMEQGMQMGTLEPAELERNSKVVASMIGGLQKVGGPEEDKVSDAQAANGGANDEVERLQRDIVERFERIQRRREAEAGPV
jgi:hypothetical protein